MEIKMIDLGKLNNRALPGDCVLTGTNSKFTIGGLIQYAQRVQTPDGKPSLWKHALMYIDQWTIAESTIDHEPYLPTGKKTDNGPQYNNLNGLATEDYASLLHFTGLSDAQRQTLIDKAQKIIWSGKYRYDIAGLFGSLLTYYLFPWCKSNPLSAKYQLYCSAFISTILQSIGIDVDENHTDRNTSPERIWQWGEQYSGIEIIDITTHNQVVMSSAIPMCPKDTQ
jgi:hypothetical protein